MADARWFSDIKHPQRGGLEQTRKTSGKTVQYKHFAKLNRTVHTALPERVHSTQAGPYLLNRSILSRNLPDVVGDPPKTQVLVNICT